YARNALEDVFDSLKKLGFIVDVKKEVVTSLQPVGVEEDNEQENEATVSLEDSGVPFDFLETAHSCKLQGRASSCVCVGLA
ncbi:hypothetical protein HAX54_000370, partial [Datura stramonium]|nr:hypothetical protein [Datura stramonium]